MNVLVLQSFLAVLSCTKLLPCVCILSSKLCYVSCVSCLICSIYTPSPHLNCSLNVVAMAKVRYMYSLDLMEAYHSLYVVPHEEPLNNSCFNQSQE